MQIKRYKSFLLFFFLLAFNAAFAQKDSIVYKIPTEGDKVVYSGTVAVNNRSAAQLDAISKSWLDSYFKYHLPAAAPAGADTTKLYNKATIEYKVRPGMVNIPFYCQFIISINCKDNQYSYRISDIYFRPKSNTLNGIGYENSPDYLVKIGKRKHLGIATSWNVTRGQIREYLTKMNAAMLECIASFNKAMTN
ncbi:MAG: hypothetical protein ACHQHN_03350 [Sphingobacteriales bacterium]